LDELLFSLNGESVSFHDAIGAALLGDQYDLVERLIESVILRQLASERGITIEQDMVQEELDAWREEMMLDSADETSRWMEINRISPGGVRLIAESQAARKALKDAIPQSDLQTFYEAEGEVFHNVDMLIFDTLDIDEANAFADNLRSEAQTMGDLVLGIDSNTSVSMDFSSAMSREDIQDIFDLDPFDLEIGEVCGPYPLEGVYSILILTAKHRPEFSEVEDAIREMMMIDLIEERTRSSYLVRHYSGEKD